MSFIFLFIHCFLPNIIISSPSCKDDTNFCQTCNFITNLCQKCQIPEILVPEADMKESYVLSSFSINSDACAT